MAVDQTRHQLSAGEADGLARLISRVDAEGKREMEPYLSGQFQPTSFLPYFRRSVKRLLAGDRLTPSQRLELGEWVARYGLDTRGNSEPRSRVERTTLSASEHDRLILAAAAAGVKPARWIYDAIMERLERQKLEKAGA